MIKWTRNFGAGGDAGRTQVAVEYNGLVELRARSGFKISIAVLLSSSYYVTPQKSLGVFLI